MKRILIFVAALVAVALAVAVVRVATSSSSPGTEPAKGAAATVQTRQFSGVGRVLVDVSGRPLYASDQETGGMVRCTGACNSFWRPLTIAQGSPRATVAGALGIVTRPDGARQVTYNGTLLYTFSIDSPGKVLGDGFRDAFGGRHFTWHVVREVGTAGSSAAPQSTGSVNRGY